MGVLRGKIQWRNICTILFSSGRHSHVLTPKTVYCWLKKRGLAMRLLFSSVCNE